MKINMLSLKIWIPVVLVIAVVIAVYIFSSKNKQRDLAEIIQSGRLTVVTENSEFGFTNTSDSIYGFQFEIVKAFANSLGLELEVIEHNDPSQMLEDVVLGQADIVAGFFPVTKSAKIDYKFSHAVLTSRLMLVQKTDTLSDASKLLQVGDLGGDTISMIRNSPFISRLNRLSDELGEDIIIKETNTGNVKEMLDLMMNDKIKLTVCPEIFIQSLQEKYPQIDFSVAVGFNQEYAWMVHPESVDLHQKLNDFLTDFVGSSAYWTLYRKYFK